MPVLMLLQTLRSAEGHVALAAFVIPLPHMEYLLVFRDLMGVGELLAASPACGRRPAVLLFHMLRPMSRYKLLVAYDARVCLLPQFEVHLVVVLEELSPKTVGAVADVTSELK